MGARASLAACALLAACDGADVVVGAARNLPVDAGDASVFVAPPCWPCSSDLRSVVACDGHTLAMCPAGQACRPFPPDGGPARCEPGPCNAAAENLTSLGCDFVVVEPDASPPGAPSEAWGGCWAALVANAWTEPLAMWFEVGNDPTSIDASPAAYIPVRTTGGVTYQPLALTDGLLSPRTMAVVFIGSDSGTPQCPPGVAPRFAPGGDFALHGTGRRNGLRLRTTLPASVFDVYPYGGAAATVPGATLLLPTSTWGRATLGVTAWAAANGSSQSGLAIASLGSTVALAAPVAVVGGLGVAPAPKGMAARYTIDPISVLQLEQPEDLTGTLLALASGAPFSVWGVHKCMSIPSGSCDSAHVELPPAHALGTQYVAARFGSRVDGEEAVPWRFVALTDGTTLRFDPPTVSAPIALGASQVATIWAPGPFVVTSQNAGHPFYASGHMTQAAGSQLLGDPETVGLVPVEQWLTSYTFAVEPSYAETSLVVVQQRTAAGYAPVALDCLPAPLSAWQPVDVLGNFQFTRVALQRGGQPVGGCDFGAHTVASQSPISVTVWGMDASASYAFPAGAGVRRINSVTVPTPQ